MFKLNDDFNKNIFIEVLNVPSEIYQKLKYQLSPFIVEGDGFPNYFIYVERSSKNVINLVNNVLYIKYFDEVFLLKTLRKAIRDGLYQNFLDDGYIKMHCSAVQKDGNVFVFIGKENTGKTSTALGLCKYCNYSLINGDLSLIKDKNLLGWSTAIGTRYFTSKLLGVAPIEELDFNNITWLWQKDYIKIGYNFTCQGIISKLIVVNYDFNCDRIKFEDISENEKRNIICSNIHYDEINKDHYWNVNDIDLDECKKKILQKNGIIDVDAFRFVSDGLSEKNIKLLSKKLER